MSRLISAILLVLACFYVAPLAADEIVRPPSRDVTPPGFTPAPKVTVPLFREQVPPPPPPPERWHRFDLPITTNAATFQVKQVTIRIAGVFAPDADATCKAANGGDWPCGRSALVAFRLFLGGRAVECYFSAIARGEVSAPCRVGANDLGLWLVARGWALPAIGAPAEYHEAATKARCERIGQWLQAGPGESCPS